MLTTTSDHAPSPNADGRWLECLLIDLNDGLTQMSIPEDISQLLSTVFSIHAVQQVAPLVVVVVVPLIVLTTQPHLAYLFHQLYMVFESLALALPWNWRPGSSASGSVSERNRLKKRVVRTRAEQVAAHDDISALAGPSTGPSYFEGYYPGLVNLSGSYCFMNATLQAMASLSYLQPHIDQVFDKAESLTNIVHTPVIDELRDLLGNLNTPTSSPMSIRPEEIITALSRSSPGKQNALFSSRQHQDAQELFQLVSECIKREISAVDKESLRDRGLGGISEGRSLRRPIGKSVFDGLTANRRSCKQCGYTEAVMHFPFDNWQLALPRMSYRTLDALLEDYTRLEELDDCICRRCSMQATHERLVREADRLTRAAKVAEASSSRKKRARDARAMEARVKAALEEGRIEDEIKGLQMEKVFSRASTKQAMIARPPAVLVLHLNRSIHYGGSEAARNNCNVDFQEYLDLTPYTTSGQLSTEPSHPISSPPRPAGSYNYPRYIYRLSSVVCHYGNHYSGHYICYRRKPRPPSAGSKRWAPPRFVCSFGCDCEKCQRYGPVRDEWDLRNGSSGGWLMANDTHVKEVGLNQVLAETAGAFMLYYERVIPYTAHHHHPQQPQQSQHGSIGKSSVRTTSTSTVPKTISTAMATVMEMERHQSSGVYSSTSTKSSEETLRPGMDALNSSRSSANAAVNGEDEHEPETEHEYEKSSISGDSGIELIDIAHKMKGTPADEDKDEEGEVHILRPIPRILFNVSPRKRARTNSIPPLESDSSCGSAGAEGSQTKDDAHVANGDTSHLHSIPTPQNHMPTNPTSPKKTIPKKAPPAALESHLIEHLAPSPTPPSTSTPTTSTAASPPSSPHRKKHRSKHSNPKQDGSKSPPKASQPTIGLHA